MSNKDINVGLLEYLSKSYSVYHAVKELANILTEHGFTEIKENENWNLIDGENYFVTKNQSALIAFTYNKNANGFNIVSTHSDSPAFKVKENFDIKVRGNYTKLNTEPYGGMIMSTWCDRALSVAGRVMVETDNGFKSTLVNIDKDLLVIPNLAIHLKRDHNDGRKFNPQQDMLPLLGDEKADLMQLVADELNVEKDKILGHDLYLYPRENPKFLGASSEFIMSPKLDDLQCAYSSIMAIVKSQNSGKINVAAVFDNEEVGSSSKQGAASTFMFDTLSRLCTNETDYKIKVANSFMISADNAHAVHHNYGDKFDETNHNFLNKGPVIKFNANQKYTTDAISASVFKKLCKNADVPYQVFHNRSDMPGGSTLGNISTQKVSLHSVDIGLPQFAMHSAVETAGTKDTEFAIKVMQEFYNSDITFSDNEFSIKNNTIAFVIASHNKGKIAEFERILSQIDVGVTTLPISDVEETGKTFLENALIKAKSVCEETGMPAIADDSGLCVDALGGEPGVYSARYAEDEKKNSTVLAKMENVGDNDRTAQFVCAIACAFPNGDILKYEGKCEGEITREVMGDGGFGYDPIFAVKGVTFAQMSNEEKDAISHRGLALRGFAELLKEYLNANK